MDKIITYIKLHYKLQFTRDKRTDKKASVLTFLLGLAVLAVGIVLLKVLFDILSTQLLQYVSAKDIANLLYAVIGVILVVIAVSKEIKMFLLQKDFNIEARFPMSNLKQFVAQLIISFIDVFVMAFILVVPIMIMFGISAKIISVSYVFGVLLSAILMPFIPFAFSLLIVVPAMWILNVLENRNILKLILFIIILVGLFVLYSVILNFVAEYYIHKKIDSGARENLVAFVLSFNSFWNFFRFYTNIAFFQNVFVSLAVLVCGFAVLMALGVLVAIPVYNRSKENILEGKKKIFSKKSKVTNDKAFSAIFKKECKEIIRTKTYAYFYLGVAIITPVMVFLTNLIIQKVGKAQMGGDIAFGVSVLVVLAFISMINSFAGSAISREGKEFYITKISPVDYRRQLFAKGLLNIIVSLVAMIITVILLCALKFISVAQGAVLFAISVFFAFGVVLNGLNISVRSPNIAGNTGGEESQTNSLVTMFIGLVLCGIEGVISIVLSFFMDLYIICLILLGLTLVYSVVNLIVFMTSTNKKYSKIE